MWVTYGLQYFKDLSYSFASFGSLIFSGLMLGRLIAGFISHRLSDRKLIRIGLITEAIGILLVLIPSSQYYLAVIGFLIIGTGMGPIYPAIQHMAPANFGKKFAAAVIGLQMASAYIGSTFMPMIFGFIQQKTGIGIMPYYLAFFALLNFIFLELAYRRIAVHKNK
ncbi:MAG: MFS transporter [Lactobacillus amylovorus]|jgi:fucose permease|nr:MFS transporter [Lactobacillus amylovorus]